MASRPIVQMEVFSVSAGEECDDFLDPSGHTVLVRLTDDEGQTGIGETDATPEAIKAFLEMKQAFGWSQKVETVLQGEEPIEAAALYDRCYEATVYPGRRGLGIHALSAVDIALHDLAGKQLGVPAYKLLGGARRTELTPYATVYAGAPGSVPNHQLQTTLFDHLQKAVELGFHAVKAEVLFDATMPDRELIATVQECRRVVGDDRTLIVDFGYRYLDWRSAAFVLNRVEDCNLFFAEAPLHYDDLIGYGRLAENVRVPIAGAEIAATRFECREWIERGKVDVLQPDITRCGGLTEIRRIAEMAALYGVRVVPHAWKTGINVAACCHAQATLANMPCFEFLSPRLWSSSLRETLTEPEPILQNGHFPLPERPGLGIELHPDWKTRFSL